MATLALMLVLNGRGGVHADALPFVTIEAPDEPFYNERFDFTLFFDNTDLNDPGYGPFIDLELPPALRYASGDASYLGVTLDDDVFLCPAAPDDPEYVHPLTEEVRPCTAGNTVAVIVLPFGSFVPTQPAAPITISSFVNSVDPAVVGAVQTISATGGFRFGNDATGSTPLWQGGASTKPVTPTIIRLHKEYVGPEDETATGPNFPRQYRIIADIADGQTLTDFDLVDLLPNNLAFLGATPVTGGGAIVDAPPAPGAPSNAPDNVVRARWGSVTGTTGDNDVEMTVDFFVPLNDANGVPVLNATTGAFVPTVNDSRANGTWTANSSLVTSNAPESDHTLSLQSLAIQKGVENVSRAANDATRPGDILQWTLQIQVSDFFAFENLQIVDEYTDGQNFNGGFAPTLSWADSGGRSGGGSFTPGVDYTVIEGDEDPPAGSAPPVRGRIEFDLSALLATTGGDGPLVGGCVPLTGVPEPDDEADPRVPDCDAYNNGATTATIVFQTVVRHEYVYLHKERPSTPAIVQGDSVSNSVVISGAVLSIEDATTPTGSPRVSDNSSAHIDIPVGKVQKSIFAINGNTTVPEKPWMEPGDRVTYRIRYDLPITRFEKFSFTDFLPLPVFDSTEGAWTQAATGVAPPAGQWALGPANTFEGKVPTVTSEAAPANTITFDYGNYDDDLSPEKVVEVLFTVTVNNEPFADGLFLTNQVRATETSTEAHASDADAIVQIRLGQPDVQIRKGVIAAPGHASLGAGCEVPNPLTSYLDVAVDCDVTDVDAGDQVTFVVVLDNIGHAPAFDLTVTDTLPAGLTNLALRGVTDGKGVLLDTPADYNGDLFGAGIAFTGPVAGLEPGEPSDGSNIRVLTFTADVANTVVPGTTLTNTATITKYAGQSTAENHVPGGRSDDATATVTSAQIAKSIIATSEAHTADADVAIGEVVTYQVVATFPEGTTPNAKITDTLPPGMRWFNCAGVVVSPGLTVGTSDCVMTGGEIGFGDVTNTGTAGSTPGTITVTYRALVENVGGNARGMTRTNSALLTFTGGSAGPATTTATIVEPALQVEKKFGVETADALDTTSITLTVSHTGASNATAFDVSLSDVLSEHLEYEVDSIECTGDVVATTCAVNGGTVEATWLSLATTETVTVTLNVQVKTTVGTGGSIENTAKVEWTSLPGEKGTGDAAQGGPGSIYGERTGTADGANSYNHTDKKILNIFGFSPGKSLRATSEAHTAGNSVAIGEVVTYRLVVDIAEGSTSNVTIEDRLPAGMQYLGNARLALVSDDGASLTSDSATIDSSLDGCGIEGKSAPADLSEGCVLDADNISTVGNNGDPVTFTLGTLTNHDDDADKELAIIEYDALVLNVVGNQTNTGLENSFIVLIDGTQMGDASGKITVTVAEPVISIAKAVTTPGTDAGDAVAYTLTVKNTASGANAAAGFDLVVTDSLPASLTSVAIADVEYDDTASCGDVEMDDTQDVTDNVVTVTITCLNPGEDVVITVTAKVVDNATAGLLVENEALVTYSSLPGDKGAGAPGDSGDEEGERNGASGVVNDYRNTSEASFSLAVPTIDKGDPSPATATIGETVSWDIVVRIPDGVTQNLVVTDHLPAGLTVVGVTLDDDDFEGTVALGDVTGTTGNITIDLGSPQADADSDDDNNSFVLRVTAHVDNVIGNQRTNTRSNTASATFDVGGVETPITDGTPPAAFTIVEPELQVVKSVDTSDGREAGSVVEYTLVVSHLGSSDATAYDVVIADTLPALLDLDEDSIAVTSPDASCVDVGAVSTGANGFTLAVGEMGLDCVITITYEAEILVGVNPGQAMTNGASATWKSIDAADGTEASGRTGADGLPGVDVLNDYRAEDDAQFLIDGAFSILKERIASDNADTLNGNLAIGETATFELTVQVLSGTIKNVSVRDNMPAGLRFVEGSATFAAHEDFAGTISQDWETAVACAGGCEDGDDVTFTLGTVVNPPGSTGTFTIRFDAVVVDSPDNEGGDVLTNTATLFYDDAGDVQQSVNSGDVTLTLVEPVLVVTKSFDRAIAAANETVEVTVTVENTGAAPAYNVTLTDVLAAPNALIKPAKVSATHDLTWATVDNTVSYTGGTIPAGATATVKFTVDLASTVVADAVIPNRAEANSTTMPGDDTAYPDQRTTPTVDDDASIAVSAPDLVVTKDDGVTQTKPGLDIVYTITYQNVGDADATGVVITETVPAHTTFNAGKSHEDWECVAGTCTLEIAGTVIAGDPAASVDFAVTVDNPVDAGVHNIENTVSIKDDGTHGPDRTPADNSDDETTPLDAVPDLRIQKSDGGVISYPGGPIAYTLTYSNVGAQGATGVVVRETVPAGVTFDAAGSHEDWVCGGVGPGSNCTYAVGALDAGDSGTVVFAVVVDDPSVMAPVVNTASITDDGKNGADADKSNDEAEDSTEIVDAVDLAVTKSVSSGGGMFVGGQVTFTVSVENLGPRNATDVVIADALPPGLMYVSQAGDGAYDAGTGLWSAGNIDFGASASIVIAVQGNTVGTHTNTATLASLNEADTNPANDTDSADVTVFFPVPPTPTPTPTSTPSATPTPTGVPGPGPGTPTVTVGEGPETPLEEGFTSTVKSTGGEVPITVTGLTVGAGCEASLRIVDFDGTVYTAALSPRGGGALGVDWVVPPGPAGTVLVVHLVVDGTCEDTMDVVLGTISRYDPSGIIVDIQSSCPIPGVQVILQRLVDGEWIIADPADIEGGTEIMDPQINPQYTLGDGSYGWDVVPGEWRISVSHPDYHPQISRSVTIPPPVFDLHMFLEPIGEPLDCAEVPTPAATGHGPGIDGASPSDGRTWMLLASLLAGATVATALLGRRIAVAVTGGVRRR
ncbi:MAG: isopeptide-forming domain-containing fimbrial protein [Dehalococcoidia bacterium]|nr:isopeptide-forming domain-containing fimbrial protein [Dehalococcoidia bacterium]